LSIQIGLLGSPAMAYSSRRVPNALTWLFLAALGAASVTRLWLAARQIRHVSAHRASVPPSFADSIPLAAHQKAADYTAAKTRLGMIDLAVGVATLLVFTLVWVAYSAALVMIYPAFIMPFFNKFTPITEGELASRVARLLERCGFKSSGLYLMDGSKRSSHGNAFFTGFGAAKRIVLFDTLVSRLQPPEVEAVLAHELGHYRLHHITKQMALSAVISLAVLAVLGQLIDRDWFYTGLGVATPSHAAALALFMMVLPEFLFFVQPLTSRYSRRREYEADAYAVSHASPQELVRALVRLYKDNAATLTPDPLHTALYDSHPPAAMRI